MESVWWILFLTDGGRDEITSIADPYYLLPLTRVHLLMFPDRDQAFKM